MGPFDSSWLIETIAFAVPLLFAATGELVSERTGVINIGLEGMMLSGAFFAFLVTWSTHSIVLGVVGAFVVGGLLASIVALLSIQARANQIVIGIGINILAGGVTTLVNEQAFTSGSQVVLRPMRRWAIPLLSDIPGIGKALFDQVPLAYVAFLLVPATWLLLHRTNWGLAIRAAGETPGAVETAGFSIVAVRWGGTLYAGSLAGLGGAMLTIGSVGVFNQGISAGQGFIALAAVIFGRWSPYGVLGACLVFGGANALQHRLQASAGIPSQVWLVLVLAPLTVFAYTAFRRARQRPAQRAPWVTRRRLLPGAVVILGGALLAVIRPDWDLPSQMWLMVPYLVTLVVLAGVAGRTHMPAYLGQPYESAQ